MAAKEEGHNANPLLNEFAQKISTHEKALDWFEENSLFPKQMKCEKCDISMVKIASPVSNDKFIWKCKLCQSGCGLRKGTVFEVSEVNFIQWFKYQNILS